MNKSTTLAMVVMSACAFTRPPAVLHAQATTPAQGSYEPHLDSSKFTSAVTHPYFPLVPGTVSDGGARDLPERVAAKGA